MLGLFGTLHMGARAMQVQQKGIEVTGHNLANVNNPAYARQRVNLQTSITIPDPLGPQGTGVEAISIQQIRDKLLDGQIQGEASVRGLLESEQRILQQAQAILGQSIDRAATGPDGSAAALGVGGQHGVAEKLSDLFNAFQEVSTNPTSLPSRQAVIVQAQNLATEFNQIDQRLNELGVAVDKELDAQVGQVNELLTKVAELNKQIFISENRTEGAANDLRDLRQQKIEELAELANIQSVHQPNGNVDIMLDGNTLVAADMVQDTLETYDAGGGQMLVRTASGTPVTLSSGKIAGLIDSRDGEVANLQTELNTLASLIISEVNTLHTAGFSLNGTTGSTMFTGTDASDIAVNATIAADPALLQFSAVNGAVGDNQVALQLAQLGQKTHASLSNQTFNESYSGTVAGFGQSLASVNSALDDQSVVERMLLAQRDSISGVSLDEEMTNLIKFQKAFEASARLMVTVDEMLQTVINLKR